MQLVATALLVCLMTLLWTLSLSCYTCNLQPKRIHLSLDVFPSAFMLPMQFAATACTIVSGAIAERTRFEAYFLYSMFMSIWVYPVVIHSIWSSSGWASAFRSAEASHFSKSCLLPVLVVALGRMASHVGWLHCDHRLSLQVTGHHDALIHRMCPHNECHGLLHWFNSSSCSM